MNDFHLKTIECLCAVSEKPQVERLYQITPVVLDTLKSFITRKNVQKVMNLRQGSLTPQPAGPARARRARPNPPEQSEYERYCRLATVCIEHGSQAVYFAMLCSAERISIRVKPMEGREMKRLTNLMMALLTMAMTMSMYGCAKTTDSGIKPEPPAKPEDSIATTTTPGFQNSVTIEQQVLVDKGDISVELLSLGSDTQGNPTLLVHIINSSNQGVFVITGNGVVNGAMIDIRMNHLVEAKSESTEAIVIDADQLVSSGISVLAILSFDLTVRDGDTMKALFDPTLVTIETSAAATTEQIFDDSGQVVYDQGGIRIIEQGLSFKTANEPVVAFYIENNSGKALSVDCRDTTINGKEVYSFLRVDIAPGKVCYTTLHFYDWQLNEKQIDKVGSIQLRFELIDLESMSMLPRSELITLTY